MRYLIILFTLLTGCASYGYQTKHGLTVYDNTGLDIPKEEIEYVVTTGLSYFGKGVSLEGYYLYLRRGLFYQPYEENGETKVLVADGYTEPGKRIHVSIFTHCVGLSSLLHELYHLVTGISHSFKLNEAWEESALLEMLTRKIINRRCTHEQALIENEARNLEGKKLKGLTNVE